MCCTQDCVITSWRHKVMTLYYYAFLIPLHNIRVSDTELFSKFQFPTDFIVLLYLINLSFNILKGFWKWMSFLYECLVFLHFDALLALSTDSRVMQSSTKECIFFQVLFQSNVSFVFTMITLRCQSLSAVFSSHRFSYQIELSVNDNVSKFSWHWHI